MAIWRNGQLLEIMLMENSSCCSYHILNNTFKQEEIGNINVGNFSLPTKETLIW
jgi:hypothetical protein